MRLAVLSDIHANLAALEAVCDELGSFDELWVLGDIVGYGPQPNEVIRALQELSARSVMGNHDGAAIGLVLTGGYRPRPAVLDAIRRADLFATLVPHDTYTVASEVHDLLVKTHAADLEKIELIKELVSNNLDMDRILGVATEAPDPARGTAT